MDASRVRVNELLAVIACAGLTTALCGHVLDQHYTRLNYVTTLWGHIGLTHTGLKYIALPVLNKIESTRKVIKNKQ